MLETWLKVQNKVSSTIPELVCFTVRYSLLSVSHSMFLLITWNMLRFVAVEFAESQLILTCSL